MPVGLPIHNCRKQQKNSCEKYCRTWYDIDIEIEINLHGTAHGKGKNTQVIALLFAGNHLLFQILTLSFKSVRIINVDGGRSLEGPWARTSVFNDSLSMRTNENQPGTGKTGLPGVGGGVFTPKALKCPSGPAGAAARLVPREVDLYKHSHGGWLLSHCKHSELYFTTRDTWDHSKLEDGFCMTFKTLRRHNTWSCVIAFVGWTNQNPCDNNTNHLKHSGFVHLHSQWTGTDKSWSVGWEKPQKQKLSGRKTPLFNSGHLNHGTNHDI